MLVPVGTDSLFGYARCMYLFRRVDADDSEWVGEAEDIEFGQVSGSNNLGSFSMEVKITCIRDN